MQRSSSSTWVGCVLEMFASGGVDVPSLVRAAGIDPARLEDPAGRFAADEVSALWALAVDASGDPSLGLDRELNAKHVNFDAIAYAMAASPDLRTGLQSMGRYLGVISDAATFELREEAGAAWLVLGGLGFSRPVPRQRYAYGLLSFVMLCEWLTRRPLVPLAVEFKFAQPPDVARYEQVFRCRLRFAAAENRILLSDADLDFPIPSRNPTVLALHEQVLQGRLRSLGASTASYRVVEQIARRLAQGEPRREEIAASLALADRTLQRRLHAEGTSFQQLLDEARSELARKYLVEARHSVAEVADLLGFVDQGNFTRACRRWFGEPPSEYRKRMLGTVPARGA